MKRIVTAVVLIPLVLLAVLAAPLWLFLLLAVVVALGAVAEYMAIVRRYELESFRLLTYLYTATVFVLYYAAQHSTPSALLAGVLLLMMLAPLLLLLAAMLSQDLRAALPGAGLCYLALPYIAIPLLLLAVVRETQRGWVFVLFVCFAVWVGDTAAMYVGRSLGRHKLAPRLSPGKTVEGAVASLACAIVVCCLYGHFVPEIALTLQKFHLLRDTQDSLLLETSYVRMPWSWAAVLAAIINVAAQLGDLMESAFKRGAGVKDSGTILPGHGGLLDRIDALLLAMPVAFLLFLAFGSRLI